MTVNIVLFCKKKEKMRPEQGQAAGLRLHQVVDLEHAREDGCGYDTTTKPRGSAGVIGAPT